MDTVTAAQRKGGKGRLLGVDAARMIALIGMMAVHLLPGADPDGTASTAYLIASGRASALFAVLAGVGLALANGGLNPPAGRQRVAAAVGIIGRAAVVGLIGIFLGDLESGVAVILINYGFLFLIAALFIGLSSRPLGWLALIWAVAAPAISIWIRARLPDTSAGVPGLNDLGDPLRFLREALLTGYYPVFTWVPYVLAGMAVGRFHLASRKTNAWLVVSGVGMAIGARLLADLLLDLGGRAAVGELPVQFFGTTPTDSWWYLAVATPHSGTTFDLIHTIGTSFAILGTCLFLASASRVAIAWLAAAGGMTLSLYTAHVIALTAGWGLDDRPTLLIWHVVLAVLIGLMWRYFIGRGPLESLAASVAGSLKATLADRRVSPRGA